MSRRRRKKKPRDRPRKGIYLLPNLLTTASLFCGFYALIAATQAHFSEAAVAIFIALILDGLDGKVARLTQTTSHFGKEYDSLADLMAFGAAPAFLVYKWSLTGFGRLGWVAAFLFVVCGALRLARFNVQTESRDPRYFYGLPIPAAAAVVAGTVLGVEHFRLSSESAGAISLVLLYLLSYLMVSNLPYRSFKEIDLRRVRSFNYLVGLVLIFSIIAYKPIHMALILLLTYLVSGPVIALRRLSRPRRPAEQEQPEEVKETT